MSDGSNMGINSKRALQTILGGADQPSEDEQQTPEQVRARIETATPTSYEGATDCIVRAVLRLFAQRPETIEWPIENTYDWSDPEHPVKVGPDLFKTAMDQATPDEYKGFDGCSGFMWGFAVNQARWLAGHDPQPNPAIVEF